ncbi:disintegrin and metalloproteinase domain-containing protein 15 isoform X3 [Pseudophryne corroboree]|uniref:disintegrin and metalloproteinase domain-containing protein 15 isoform X3 n=1 Tax=Pseudophryne corroboree TaxID=495146 RepID=UPI00308137AC
MRDGPCRLLLLLCGLTAAHPGRDSREADTDPPVVGQARFWAVYPELRRDGHRLTLEEAVQALPGRLQLSMQIDGNVVQIELQHNRHLLPHSHTVTYYLPDGRRRTNPFSEPVNCYYQGKVQGERVTWSSLSLCSGLRGTIVMSPERQYSIEPVSGDPYHKHILRQIQDRRNVTCETRDRLRNVSANHRTGRALLSTDNPHLTEEERSLSHQAESHRVRRDVTSEMKYVELVIVADNSEYQMLHRDLKALYLRILEIANKVDAYYRVLNVRVLLVMVEVWSQKDQITVSTDPAETLSRFLSWREKELLPRVHHDNAQLLTGVTFTGSSVGMATINSICTADRSGGVNMDHSVSILGVASTVAHELGHNLGLSHDTGERKCGQPTVGKQWIMERSSGFMPGLEFSECSLSDLTSSLQQGGGVCLFNVPKPDSIFGAPICGNLVVEKGEQCDCGLVQDCTDPCCNASTCQLVEGAECAMGGLCCEQCQMKHSGTMCREPLGDCDLPEFCTGASPHCPPNVYFQDGEPCGKGQAHCYQGECRTLQSQCQYLWGPGSSPAPLSCFAKVNMRGDKYGNCGRRVNGTYLPCTPRNVLCGTIQCQGGSNRPLLGYGAKIITISVLINGSQTSCRGTYFNLGDDIWDLVAVKTGTVCGAGKVCVNQQCQDVAALKVQSCRNKCGGHGICNSNNNCHCDLGWAPPDCEQSGYGGSADSGPVALERGSSTVTSTVLPVLLLLLLLLCLIITCYRKRSCIQSKLSNTFSKSSKCQYRVTQNSSQPRPQRPPPPHWTQSTELQVMSASHQPDYQGTDRPEPPSKPLPPDPVLRRCQVSASVKPPLPKKPIPLSPVLPCQDPLLGVPAYPDHITALPTRRHAPPPPYTGRTPWL